MGELRARSTRANITSTSFTNDYAWGSFKGDVDAWMEKYFDAFLYLAHWGTHILQFRLPAELLDLRTASAYCAGRSVSAREKAGKVILRFESEDDHGEDWVEGLGRLAGMIAVRDGLLRGDLRDMGFRSKAGDFPLRLEQFRQAHAQKSALLKRIRLPGL